MILTNDQLIGLKVITKNGQVIGKIKDFEFEAESSKIIKYIISSSDLVKKITSQNLIIGFDQVVEITAEAMIVEDNTVEITETIKQTISA
ncbi:MAG: PRC-barrel domain-containing protein [Candidatus Buchananbacteria bacterium]|nr:PRC-barrel domain-containing protein [Candidatus Buchananbacteria bacterium]